MVVAVRRVTLASAGQVVLAVLLVATLVAGSAAPAVATPGNNSTTTATPTPTPTATPAGNNSTGTTTPSAPVPISEQVRISPVKFQADYLHVVVTKPDTVFNTTGEFAVFTLSHEVQAARITQKPAEAQVLKGGQTVKVEYQPNAAPPGEQSLYTLELFFTDGSTKTVKLYASKTDQSVAAARLQEWEPVIDELCEFATEHGYKPCNPEKASEFLTWVNNRADLVEGFLTRLAVRTIGWVVAGVMNPVVDLLVLFIIAAAAAYRQRKHGDLLEALQRMAGVYEQKIDRLELDHERAKRTADDDDLADVSAIGSTWAPYWEDAYGVKSPYQLARMAAAGAERATEDGLERVHDGVYDDDLEPGSLQDSWLEPILRHVERERVALTHILRTFDHVESKHNLGHHFRDARARTEDLLTAVEQREEYPTESESGRGSGFGPGPSPGAGGD